MQYNIFSEAQGGGKMSKHLFVAEADKIQDLLFRSSKLREVAGGSQMLTEFCKETVCPLIQRFGGEKVISAGGSFRIRFDTKERAEEFGDYLSELYRRDLGGTITVAKPVEVTTEQEAIENAQTSLRKAKHSGKAPVSLDQIPYIAICASCGTGIASYHKSLFDENPNYLCEVCDKKANARKEIKMSFLARFLSLISTADSETFVFPYEADEIAKLEPRKYVAYIIADVNSMGKIFSECDSFEKVEKLSMTLDDVIQDSLAEPTKILIEKQKELIAKTSKLDLVPVLPLILGGDDVFALIPAQWALDFTQRFAHEFEEKMTRRLGEIGIQRSPNISAAVIICKGKFPYSIAHELGEELLKKAKRRAKKEQVSTISFALIKGNELVKSKEEEKKKTFVAGFPTYTIDELKKLVEYRFELRNLPGTRRAQLEKLFLRLVEIDHDKMRRDFAKILSEWTAERTRIINRLEEKLRETLNEALEELGDKTEEHNWLYDGVYYHKLPDLLIAWDYAYNLEKEVSEYEEVDEE